MENFYLIYGPEKSLIQNELNNLIKKLKIDDVIKYDMTNSSILDVIEDASTVGLFSTKKVIILDDCYFLGANKTIDNLALLEQYLEKYNKDNYCIFLSYNEKVDTRKKVYKLLSKHKVIELKKIDEEYIKKYIEQELNKENYKIESINYFIEKVGNDLNNAKNELNKLMNYKLNDKLITNKDIDKITIHTIEEEIFALSDAIIAKDTKKALILLEDFLNKNYDEIQIIMLLASQFRFLFQVKHLLNKNMTESEIAKVLVANPYRIKFTVRKLYPYSEKELLDYIQKLAKIDHDIKLGIMNKKLALELFIIENK